MNEEDLEEYGDVNQGEDLQDINGHSIVRCIDGELRGYLRVKWDNGAMSWSHWINVAKDMGWKTVGLYITRNNLQGNIWTDIAPEDEFEIIGRRMVGNLKTNDDKDDGNKKRKDNKYYISEDEYLLHNKCNGNTHFDYTIGGYLEETNILYCTAGNDLEGLLCCVCGAHLVHKEKSIAGETFRPSLSTPVYTCSNRRGGCNWALCYFCFMDKQKTFDRCGRNKRKQRRLII